MAEEPLKSFGAGYNLVAPLYPNQLSIRTEGCAQIVIFKTDFRDTQLSFRFDDSYPSRLPQATVASQTLSEDQKSELIELLQKAGRAEEYTNNPSLPLLLKTASTWLKDNYTKKPAGKNKGNNSASAKPPPNAPTNPTEPCLPEPEWPKQTSGEDWGAFKDVTSYIVDTAYDLEEEDSDEDWRSVARKKRPTKKQKGSSEMPMYTLDTVPVLKSPPDNRRANYFVAVRCTSEEIGDAVEDLVQKMLSVDDVYKPICYNRNEVHVTLTTVALHNDEEIQAAVKALEDAREVLTAHAPTSLMTIDGVDNFQGSKVVYGKVKVDDDVLLLRKVIRWAFQKARIAPRDNYDYHPHMTVAKTNMKFTSRTQRTKIDYAVYKSHLNTYFGKQSVSGIHLCQMGPERRADGFYVCPTNIDFKK